MNHYIEASKIDDQINKLLIKYPISENKAAWRCFINTINSGLTIISLAVEDSQAERG